MAKIKIQNIGPITNVEMKLNKVNMILSPQSSGKSTIAKLISYCQWVERRCLLDGEYKEDVHKQLLDFHHLHLNYFSDNSLFEYVCANISFPRRNKTDFFSQLVKGGEPKQIRDKHKIIIRATNHIKIKDNKIIY